MLVEVHKDMSRVLLLGNANARRLAQQVLEEAVLRQIAAKVAASGRLADESVAAKLASKLSKRLGIKLVAGIEDRLLCSASQDACRLVSEFNKL